MSKRENNPCPFTTGCTRPHEKSSCDQQSSWHTFQQMSSLAPHTSSGGKKINILPTVSRKRGFGERSQDRKWGRSNGDCSWNLLVTGNMGKAFPAGSGHQRSLPDAVGQHREQGAFSGPDPTYAVASIDSGSIGALDPKEGKQRLLTGTAKTVVLRDRALDWQKPSSCGSRRVC